ncbi:LysR substrate-binding domain-containing protein (plasmid) [Pantoea sp. C3]|uniref:LysR substrate-binding domain-containing protein n=1 Tax=Pantoea phytostimulans TaxID=2769024 RepID=UPI0038F717ED
MQKSTLPNLRHLNLALTILAGSSLRTAARICNMTQPAASLAISSLEDLLGVTLFERAPRGLMATQYARVLNERGIRAFSFLTQAMTLACGESANDALISRKLIGLTTAQLQAMTALRNSHNFVAAAADLRMQPQSLKRTILTLEGWLGFAIMASDETSISMTEKGLQVGQLMSQAVCEIRALRTEIREMDSQIDGTVVIGSVRATASHLIPEAILRLNEQYPFGKFSVIRESYDVMMDALEAAKLDYVCTTIRPKLSSGLTGEVLASSQLRVMCSANHPLARKEIQLDDLLEFPWVGPPGVTGAAFAFRQLFELHGMIPPAFAIETFATEWTQDLVMRSNYLLLCNTTQLNQDKPPFGMVYLKGITFGDPRPIWLIHRKDFKPTHFQSSFKKILKSVCNTLNAMTIIEL